MAGKQIRAKLSENQRGLFSRSTNFYSGASQRIGHPFKEMTIGRTMNGVRFTDARYMELPSDYSGYGRWKAKGQLKTKGTWFVTGNGSVTELTLKEFILHLTMAAHQVNLAAEHFRLVLAHRALKIFQDSFEMKRFNSAGYGRWKAISSWTLWKRKSGGVWPVKKDGGYRRRKNYKKSKYYNGRIWPHANGLLQDSNALYKSLKVVKSAGPFTSGVIAFARYAGIHNDPENADTYGDGFNGVFKTRKQVTERKFMGHSTLLDEFISQYEKQYLFDTVFRAPTRAKK